MKRLLVLLLGLLLGALPALGETEDPSSMLVLGVIASADPDASVALLKSVKSGKTFAARVGQEVARDTVIRRVTREFVYFEKAHRLEKVRVGEQLQESAFDSGADVAVALDKGMERSGNRVRVAASLREYILKKELSKVLMQAAAVPYYVNGALAGFRLLDIDQGSLFDKVGFVDGDVVTAINGQTLTDVGLTIRILNSLKDEPRADITFLRGGAEQTLQVVVE